MDKWLIQALVKDAYEIWEPMKRLMNGIESFKFLQNLVMLLNGKLCVEYAMTSADSHSR